MVDQSNAYEPLPGMHVNGQLTLGENIADLEGIASPTKPSNGRWPRPRRGRSRLTGLPPNSGSSSRCPRSGAPTAKKPRCGGCSRCTRRPGQSRAIGAHVNVPEFYEAFGIKPGVPMWRPLGAEAKIGGRTGSVPPGELDAPQPNSLTTTQEMKIDYEHSLQIRDEEFVDLPKTFDLGGKTPC